MPKTLFTKLALALTVLLLGIGLLYSLLSTYLTRHYQQEFLQNLNRDLASNLVTERELVNDGVLNQSALKETFTHYMMVNPSIEIYLLDSTGHILSYSADPGQVKRKKVAMQAFNVSKCEIRCQLSIKKTIEKIYFLPEVRYTYR